MLYDRKWEKSVVVVEPWRQRLLDAADLLERSNWCRFVTELDCSDGKPAYCMVGAMLNLERSEGREEAFRRLTAALTTRLKLKCAKRPYYGVITHWNDRKASNKQAVIDKLREVASAP